MDRIEFAERGYLRIMARPSGGWSEFPVGPVRLWLEDDVLPAVEEFINRPVFRDYASWPLTALLPGAGTPERAAVEAVDAALVAAAKALARVADGKRVARVMAELNPPTPRLVETSATISARGIERTRGIETFDDLPIYRNQVRCIADRAWIDLVCAEDYFEPRGGLLLKNPPVGATQGEFVVRLNPELHPVGDFVTRCMIRRVEVWMACLKEYRKMCLDAVLRVGRRDTPLVTAERQAWKDLASASSSLRALCLTGPDAAVRDSCVILAQVYSAFHPAPDLSWLGLPGPLVAADAGVLRHRVTNVRDVEMVERIAAAVGDLRRLYRDLPPGLSARDEGIASRGLVLLNQAHLVYWEAERINVDWYRHDLPWKLLRALAVKAPLGAAVELRDVYGDRDVSESALTTLNGRLKALLPASLWKLIRPTGQRSYRLHLGRTRVYDLP